MWEWSWQCHRECGGGRWGVVATHRGGGVDRIAVQGDSVQRGGRRSAVPSCYVVVVVQSALQALAASPRQLAAPVVAFPPFLLPVTEPTNYTKLNNKIIHQASDLANLSPYNPVVREIMTDFKPTYIPAKIVISLAVTITKYIKSSHCKYIRV
jgi:hypothetical protein